jgi:hypothetical protein
MKKTFIFALMFLFLASMAFPANAADFWATRNSNKYHYTTCKSAKKIKPSNLVKYSSPEEATKAGKIPCKICKPPVSSR